MKKQFFYRLLLLSVHLLALFSSASISISASNEMNPVVIHYFYEQSCPNCQQVTEFLDVYLPQREHITLIRYDVARDRDAETTFLALIDFFDRDVASVPFIVIGGTALQGLYQIKADLSRVVEFYEGRSNTIDVVNKLLDSEDPSPNDIIPIELIGGRMIVLPIIGEIDLASFSLLIGAIVIGLIDGFNPCAMWILLFLITLLIQMKNRKKMWLLGLTFILTSGLVYYVIMLSWLQVVLRVATIRAFQIGIGVLAMLFSLFSFRHFWSQNRKEAGCEITNTNQKRKIMDRAKRMIAKSNVLWAMGGIAGLAISVNIIELACSAGLPVIYSTMLAYHNVSSLQSALYIFIYVLFFIFDDLLIFSIAAITFRVRGISMKYEKYSSLIGGIIMVVLGILLIFFPSLLV